jgi:hypothetical protein
VNAYFILWFNGLDEMPEDTAGIAYHCWNYYEFTKDRAWLEEWAYPMMKGAAEFLRNYPHLRKEEAVFRTMKSLFGLVRSGGCLTIGGRSLTIRCGILFSVP